MSTPGEILEALGREARSRLGNGRGATTRVYRGRSVDELVPQIQRDLGADAIIVRRREGLTGGMMGFFQRAFVEIEAMPGGPGVDLYDEPASPPPPTPMPPQSVPAPAPAAPIPPPAYAPGAYAPSAYAPAAPTPAAPPPAAAPPTPTQRPTFEYRSGSMGTPNPPPAPVRPAQPTPAQPALPDPFYTREAIAPPPAGAGSAYVTAHLAALARADRSKLSPRSAIPERSERETAWSTDFQELIPREQPELFQPPVSRELAPRAAAGERRVVPPGSHARARAGVARSLQRCGISEQLADELIDGASAHALALAPRSGLAQAVRATLAQRIPVAPPLPTRGAAIVIVGAGGAGKTTCVAALLGAYRKSSSLPAACATITREAERGELRMILSPYVMKPTSPAAPRALRALRKARKEGVALIDTPSLSPSDRTGVRELARLLAELEPERIVVALPATLGATAAAQLLQALHPLGANALAVTHVDETDQLGVAVEAACRFGLAPEYTLERAAAGGWRLRQISPTALAEKLLP